MPVSTITSSSKTLGCSTLDVSFGFTEYLLQQDQLTGNKNNTHTHTQNTSFPLSDDANLFTHTRYCTFTVATNDVLYCKSTFCDGILPKMLREILATRIMTKKAMKAAKHDPTLFKTLNNRQVFVVIGVCIEVCV
jgi:DNA polymerase elongation subunit (family B)